MKKLMLAAAFIVVAAGMTGCGSLRTPATGKNHNLNYYSTFFGLSFESAVFGDGLVVNPASNN